MTFRCDMTN